MGSYSFFNQGSRHLCRERAWAADGDVVWARHVGDNWVQGTLGLPRIARPTLRNVIPITHRT